MRFDTRHLVSIASISGRPARALLVSGLLGCVFSIDALAQSEPAPSANQPATQSEISLWVVAAIVVGIIVLLAIAWYNLNERTRLFRRLRGKHRHHKHNQKPKRLADFIEIKK